MPRVLYSCGGFVICVVARHRVWGIPVNLAFYRYSCPAGHIAVIDPTPQPNALPGSSCGVETSNRRQWGRSKKAATITAVLPPLHAPFPPHLHTLSSTLRPFQALLCLNGGSSILTSLRWREDVGVVYKPWDAGDDDWCRCFWRIEKAVSKVNRRSCSLGGQLIPGNHSLSNVSIPSWTPVTAGYY